MGVVVHLFGPFCVTAAGAPVRLALAGVTRDLLAYCFHHAERDLRRERLSDLFWEGADPARAKSALSSAVYRLRRALEPLPDAVLRSDGDVLRLELGAEVTVDAAELAAAVEEVGAGPEDGAPTRLAHALDDAEAPFMEGAVSEWALVEREHMFNLRMRGLGLLMRRLGHARRYEEALAYGRRLLDADPFREAAQCEVMWLYVLNGQRAKALAQYRAYSDLLERELGVSPMAETEAVYRHILADSPSSGGLAPPQSPDVGGVLAAIERARRDVYATLEAQHTA